MKVEDFYVQKRRGWVRLHEKGGKVTELPGHHNLDQYLEEWIWELPTERDLRHLDHLLQEVSERHDVLAALKFAE
jgi:hypothetical protein